MKRKIKDVLKCLKNRGYNWEADPMDLYNTTKEDSCGRIIMSNRDVQNLFKFIFATNNHLNVAKDVLRKQYYDSSI